MNISRRDFLSLGSLSLGCLSTFGFRSRLPEEDRPILHGYGRITADWLYVRERPSFLAERVGNRVRDQVIPLLERVESLEGPEHNPRWYRVVGGYIHSGYVQPVATQLQRTASGIPEGGQLAEVVVPISKSLQFNRTRGWQPLYRLYFESMHWVTGIEHGPDKKAWYQITDDRHHQFYYVPAAHLRMVSADELAPISPEIPLKEKRIEVSIADQTVTCYESEKMVFSTSVSTGVHSEGETDNGIPTDTPSGHFRISWKMPVRHMGNGDLTADLNAYELPGVPWCSFFVSTGVAFHGTYWHDNYGKPMSRGCVNMRPADAKWLFRWTQPVSKPDEWFRDDVGTAVQVI